MSRYLKIVMLMLFYTTLLSAETLMWSQQFKPSTEDGQNIFKITNKEIYPKDVLSRKAGMQDTWIAWGGIVKKVEFLESRYGPAAKVTIEHHFFDWIEDHGAQKELFFLSPRGEGDFDIFVPVNMQKPENERIPLGIMAVVIGKPQVVIDKDNKSHLVVLTKYYDFIKKSAFRMDVFDYGRNGEPIHKVENSIFWQK
jgi:hypothetical protein